LNSHQLLLYNTSLLSSGEYIFTGADMISSGGFYSSKYNAGNSSCSTFNVNANTFSTTYPELSYAVTPFPLDITIVINAVPFDYYTGINDSLLCYNAVNSVAAIEEENISAFPNPATNTVTFNFPADELQEIQNRDGQIITYNLYGNRMYCKIISSKISAIGIQITLDVSHLSQGIYFSEIGNNKIRFEVLSK
jgi:hypothetical protein